MNNPTMTVGGYPNPNQPKVGGYGQPIMQPGMQPGMMQPGMQPMMQPGMQTLITVL